jgi:hypothetical protein
MRWRRAWTGELATGHYSKLDITLDEEDLQRLLAELLPGVPPASLTVTEAWLLLEQEAELLLAMEQTVRLHHNVEGNGKLIAQLHDERNVLLTRLRARLGIAETTP